MLDYRRKRMSRFGRSLPVPPGDEAKHSRSAPAVSAASSPFAAGCERRQTLISSDSMRMCPVSACSLSDTISVHVPAGGLPRSAASAGVLAAS